MKILITGAKGFVGQNLCSALREIKLGHDRRVDHRLEIHEIYEYNRDGAQDELERFCSDCDFVFHLAGVNRPDTDAEFMTGNFGLSSAVLETLKRYGNTCPVMLASSVQASLAGRYAGSAYGKSKQVCEELFFTYARETGAKVLVYRFPNIFGKWCRPNYNSAIATFCHNVARDIPIQVNDPDLEMDVVYIDDVVDEMIRALHGDEHQGERGYCTVPIHYKTTLGHIADLILSFPGLRKALEVPQLDDSLTKKLYSTYLSYLPPKKFIYDLSSSRDDRGSFTEVFRTESCGQFSVNISKPGVTKGDHWHQSKNEKFIVVKGNGLIRLRRMGLQPDGSDWPVTEFHVSGDYIQVVEMIPGHTHSLVNLSGTEDLVTLIWVNEPFDSERPDTFFEKV